jgi:hypothetical protein
VEWSRILFVPLNRFTLNLNIDLWRRCLTSRGVSKNNDEQVNLVEIALPSSAYHGKGVGASVIKPGTVRRLSKLRISVVRYLIKKRDALCSTLIVLPINFVEVDRI